jgi:hypothetical protein
VSSRKPCLALLALLLAALIAPAAAHADFGIHSLAVETLNQDGSVDLQAGSHPFEFKVGIVMNQDSKGNPEGTLTELLADLPAGMIGDPLAVPRCSGAQFEGQVSRCPGNTQIGIVHAHLVGIEETIEVPLYNLTPPLGVPASVGFSIASENSFQEASLRPSDYGVRASDITLPTANPIRSVTETIWGVPALASHDPQRTCFNTEGLAVVGCANESNPVPFLSLPTSCSGPLETTITVSSLEEPGAPRSQSVESLGDDHSPEGLQGCDRPPFDPSISAQPETSASDSPTGLKVGIHLPQNLDPQGTATAHLKETVVTLPAGLQLNSSAADGLGACSEAQIELHGPAPAACPPDSKLGTVSVKSPLVDHPLAGSVYLARQGENPFGSLIALYIAVDDPLTGLVVKQPLEVEPDIHTGQLTTTTPEIPQLPFEDLEFHFDGGPRAPLTTPSTCGPDPYTTQAQMVPWSTPQGPTRSLTDQLQISSGPGGGPCPQSESQMPNAPAFATGTAAPLAGAYAPFELRLARENGSQRFAALNTTLPAGVSANFNGVAECSEAQIAQAIARNKPGQGALEKASPSCPAASQIGTVTVGAGSANPFYVQGNVYLAGPYKGAPFSLAIITPAVAGPLDLGVVVVRAALYVNETTGQGTVKSDPLPQIIEGIPLDVRSVAVRIDRSGYVLNPTSCAEKAVSGEEISATGAIAAMKSRFQVGGCKGLDFTPKLALSMKGGTKRSAHPAFKAVLTQPSGQANIARTSVILPPSEFIDQNHISNPCTRPQFAAGQCPPGSVLGTARAFTPLLEKPLEGKVYFRSNGGERALPDLVVDLNGRIHFVLVGFVDSVHKKGSESSRVRTTFATVPDAPVSKFVLSLQGGKKGLLVNSTNICKAPNTATVKMAAQNGKTDNFDTAIATSCK